MAARIVEAWTAFDPVSGMWSASVVLKDRRQGSKVVSGPAYRRMTPKGDRMTGLFEQARKQGIEIGHRVA